jgi:hypothetical protein
MGMGSTELEVLFDAYDSLLGSVDVEAENKAQQYHASECVWKRRAERAERKIDAALALYGPQPGIAIGRSRWRSADDFLVAIRTALTTIEKLESNPPLT